MHTLRTIAVTVVATLAASTVAFAGVSGVNGRSATVPNSVRPVASHQMTQTRVTYAVRLTDLQVDRLASVLATAKPEHGERHAVRRGVEVQYAGADHRVHGDAAAVGPQSRQVSRSHTADQTRAQTCDRTSDQARDQSCDPVCDETRTHGSGSGECAGGCGD
jgi:hypothetical protein